jgi:hypothetical protein
MGDHQEVHRFMRLNLALGIALLAGTAVYGQLPKSGTLSTVGEPVRSHHKRNVRHGDHASGSERSANQDFGEE